MSDQEKLVRDKVPELIRAHGQVLRVREVQGDEYRRLLAAKLLEEAREFTESGVFARGYAWSGNQEA